MPTPAPVPPPTRTKIVATLGPASDPEPMIAKLIEAGVSVFRLNFSHGELDQHLVRLRAVRRVAEAMGRPIAVLGDLCGPKIRLGAVPKGTELAMGQEVLFGDAAEPGTPTLPTTYAPIATEVTPGQRVLINDGAVRLLAVERGERALRCRVTVGGPISTGKGINLPDTALSVPAITDRDWDCVAWAVEHQVDFLALSFVRSAAEVHLLKERLAQLCPVHGGAAAGSGRAGGHRALIAGATIPVIAKIEKPQAVAGLDAIVDAADAVMVARGDLGVEMDIAQVPVVQRRILARCAEFGKPCIVATQMLETMIDHAAPTRAEAGDVATAVYQGADAVMLSAETAVGKHPALVVDTMRRIVAAAEADLSATRSEASPPAKWVESRYATAALAHGAWHIARDIGARLVVCWSEHGGTARYLSQQGFAAPIIAYTSSPLAARRMALLKNVTPIRRDPPAAGTLAEFTDTAERDVLERGWAREGDPVLLLAGKPLGAPKATNSIATLYLGDPTGGYRSHKS